MMYLCIYIFTSLAAEGLFVHVSDWTVVQFSPQNLAEVTYHERMNVLTGMGLMTMFQLARALSICNL